jgi:hypothetical protein
MFRSEANAQDEQLHLGHLPAGIYLLRVTFKAEILATKIFNNVKE